MPGRPVRSLTPFIRENKKEIDAYILPKVTQPRLNDGARRQWVLSDEPLYRWAIAWGWRGTTAMRQQHQREDDMGAWGYEGLENDAALDWLGKVVMTPAARVIRDERANPDEVLAAMEVLIRLNSTYYVDPAVVRAALDRVRKHDEDSGWRDAESRRDYLDRLASKFKLVTASAAYEGEP